MVLLILLCNYAGAPIDLAREYAPSAKAGSYRSCSALLCLGKNRFTGKISTSTQRRCVPSGRVDLFQPIIDELFYEFSYNWTQLAANRISTPCGTRGRLVDLVFTYYRVFQILWRASFCDFSVSMIDQGPGSMIPGSQILCRGIPNPNPISQILNLNPYSQFQIPLIPGIPRTQSPKYYISIITY